MAQKTFIDFEQYLQFQRKLRRNLAFKFFDRVLVMLSITSVPL